MSHLDGVWYSDDQITSFDQLDLMFDLAEYKDQHNMRKNVLLAQEQKPFTRSVMKYDKYDDVYQPAVVRKQTNEPAVNTNKEYFHIRPDIISKKIDVNLIILVLLIIVIIVQFRTMGYIEAALLFSSPNRPR